MSNTNELWPGCCTENYREHLTKPRDWNAACLITQMRSGLTLEQMTDAQRKIWERLHGDHKSPQTQADCLHTSVSG